MSKTRTEHYVDAETAAAKLGVNRATLYAYVSRGLIHTAEAGDDTRRRLYNAHDIDEMQKRKSVGRRPKEVAATTLDWGLPVLASGITLIDNGHLHYRGHDVATWSETATLEETARLLWDCGSADPFAEPHAFPAAWKNGLLQQCADLPLAERCQALIPFVSQGRATAWQRNSRWLWPGAAALLRAMAAAATGTQPDDKPVHQHLAEAWALDGQGADILRRALVLVADHELNASAFAVRVVASTGASLGACLNAGLGALSGPLHGGMTSLVELLFDEAEQSGDAGAIIEKRLRRGDSVPGFGHQLYPEGDPRAEPILTRMASAHVHADLAAVMEETTGKRPNIDFALVAARRALKLPEGAALALFAIGRSVGWIAHALEQHGEGRLIRPRARYIGNPAAGGEATD